MAKLTVGELMPDFTYETPFAKDLTLSETVGRAKKTALLFLRYYGCTLCQYDIHQLQAHHGDLTAHEGQVLVVLQSDPRRLAEELKTPEALPFPLICDPEGKLYRQFSIEPAANKAQLADMKVMAKIAKAAAAGFKHGAYEGDELQLPAAFVLTPERELTYVRYAKSAGDMPEAEELAELLA